MLYKIVIQHAFMILYTLKLTIKYLGVVDHGYSAQYPAHGRVADDNTLHC